MQAINILLADDHELILSGLKNLLSTEPAWKVICQVSNGKKAVQMAAKLQPHVAILDVNMPELDGIEATRQIRCIAPYTEILILTMLNTESVARDAIEAGAKGFITKTDSNNFLKDAISSLAAHHPFFTGAAADIILQGYCVSPPALCRCNLPLTERECEILKALPNFTSIKQIAISLSITEKTIEAHCTNIMRKFHLSSMTQLVAFASKNATTPTQP